MKRTPEFSARRTAYASGLAAENAAASLLEREHYKIVARRFRTKGGEIDLVARRGTHIAFIEVKKRKTHDEAAYAVTPRQQARIAQAAEVFLGDHAGFDDVSVSFDVVLVSSGHVCNHIEQAFLA